MKNAASKEKKTRVEVKRTDREARETETASFAELITQGRALFLLIAATVLVYANSLSGAFVFDDTKQIAGNPTRLCRLQPRARDRSST